MDELLKLSYRYWKEQYEYNKTTLVTAFEQFDEDKDGHLQFAEFSKLMQFVSGDTHLSNRKLERMFREANSSYDFDDDSQALSHEELRHLAEVCMSNGIVVDTERDEMMEHLMAYVEEERRMFLRGKWEALEGEEKLVSAAAAACCGC